MARSFTGATDGAENTATFSVSCTKGGVGVWFKPNWSSGAGNGAVLWSFQATTGGTRLLEFQHFSDNNLYLGFEGFTGDQRLVVADTGLFTNGTWAHYLLTWDNTVPRMTFYVNGIQKGQRTLAMPTGVTLNAACIGNWLSGLAITSPANGAVAEATYWPIELTVNEALALARTRNSRSIRPMPTNYWPLWGKASPEPDLAGSAVNLTLTGTAAANHAPTTLWTRRPETYFEVTIAAPDLMAQACL